jgi:hypothetical protein
MAARKKCSPSCRWEPNEDRVINAIESWAKNEKYILDSILELKAVTKTLSDLLTNARLKIAAFTVVSAIMTSAITGTIVYFVTRHSGG